MSTTSVGSTAHFSIAYDSSLGSAGSAAANAVMKDCEARYAELVSLFSDVDPDEWFGIDVTIVPSNGSWDGINNGDDDIKIAVIDPLEAQWVFVAELAEIFMAEQGGGWDPGDSKGEGLSCYLANRAYPDVRAGSSGAGWLSTVREDWVNKTESTDKHAPSTECAILFLTWMREVHGLDLRQIIASKSDTLRGVWRDVTGRRSDPFVPFADALTMFDSTRVLEFYKDNPFPLPTLAALSTDPAIATGEFIPGTVALASPYAAADLFATLSSSRSEVSCAPKFVPLPYYTGIGSFDVFVAPGSVPMPMTDASITARLGTQSITMHTRVGSRALSRLTLSTPRVIAGQSLSAVVSITVPNPYGDVVVQLSTDRPGLVQLPAEVRILRGASSARFRVVIRGRPGMYRHATAKVSASFGGQVVSARLVVDWR